MNLENTSAIVSDKNVVIGTNASADNGTDNVVIGYQSSTRDDRGTIAGSMSVGAALGIISRSVSYTHLTLPTIYSV